MLRKTAAKKRLKTLWVCACNFGKKAAILLWHYETRKRLTKPAPGLRGLRQKVGR